MRRHGLFNLNLLTLLLLIASILVAGVLTLFLFVATWGKYSEFSEMLSSLEGGAKLMYVTLLAIHSWPALVWFSILYSLLLRWVSAYRGLRSPHVIVPVLLFALLTSVLLSAIQQGIFYNTIALDTMVLASQLVATFLSTVIAALLSPSVLVLEASGTLARLYISLLVMVVAGYVLSFTVSHVLRFPPAVSIVTWSIGITVLTVLVARHYKLPDAEIVWIVFGVLGFWLLPQALRYLGSGLMALFQYSYHLSPNQQDFALWYRQEMTRGLLLSARYFIGMIVGLVTTHVAIRISRDKRQDINDASLP